MGRRVVSPKEEKMLILLPILGWLFSSQLVEQVGELFQCFIWMTIFVASLWLYRRYPPLYLLDTALAIALLNLTQIPLLPIVSASLLTASFFFLLPTLNGKEITPRIGEKETISIYVIILWTTIIIVDSLAVLLVYPYCITHHLEKVAVNVFSGVGDSDYQWVPILGSGDLVVLGITTYIYKQKWGVAIIASFVSLLILWYLPLDARYIPATPIIIVSYVILASLFSVSQRRRQKGVDSV